MNNNLGTIVITSRTTQQKTSKGLFYGSDGSCATKTSDVAGTISTNGKYPATRMLFGTRKRSKKESHRGLPDPEGRDTVHKSSGGDKNCPLENIRIMKVSNNSFRVSFSLPHDILDGHVEIVTVGENGKSSRLIIKSANGLIGCTDVRASHQRINFSSMSGNEKVKMEFSLVDNREYAMEVYVYEHN